MAHNITTLLEDTLERLNPVPLDIRRYMELIRDLDKQWTTKMSQLKKIQNDYISNVRRKLAVRFYANY